MGFDTWPKDYYHGYWDRIHALYNVSNLPRLLGQNTRPLQRFKLTTATGTEYTPSTTFQTYHGYWDRIHALYNVSNLPRLLGQNTRPLQRFKLTTATGTEYTPSTTFQTYHGYWDRIHALYNVPNLSQLLEQNTHTKLTIITGTQLRGQNAYPRQGSQTSNSPWLLWKCVDGRG